jgi:hypothetical protein
MSGEASSLAVDGYLLLPYAVDPALSAALVDEAKSSAMTARRVNGDYYRVNDDRSLSSPRRLRTAAAGPVLDAVHCDGERVAELTRIFGGPVGCVNTISLQTGQVRAMAELRTPDLS